MRGHWKVLLAIPGIVLSVSSGVHAQSCEPAAASVISVQGDVEVSESARADWQDVQLNQVLCAGQQVRLMAKSRAVLQLPNETLVHLDEGSVFTLRAVEPEKPAWLDLLHGALHIISRVPRALNIRTPFVNAGIEGTEFALRVDPAQAELWVYEGRVRFSNRLGQLLIASGEAAAAARGRPPERRIVVKPRRAVEWALYYPPLLDSRPERYPEPLRTALTAYRRNDFTAAFAALDGVPEGARDARYHTLRAGLLLSVGRVPEAERDLRFAERLDPKSGTAYALRSVIAVVRNETDKALRLAQEAVTAEPRSPTPYVARSYAEQSAFEIEPARESLQKATELAPEDALVWARLAEIELSLGDLDAALEAARKAEQIDPGLSRTQSVLGFAYLTRIEVDRAKTAFERAIVLDPADPLPRLGLGLARIREGDVDEGTKEIETAASLDPNNSLIRSYLGKAYFEQKRGGLASTELEQAKLLDPKDPTPWFYDAIHKQTTNRPVEALHDLQHSIDLNDNRAVYRSRFLLDSDLAARSASLGRIYRDLGFEQLALVEGWKSVNADPSNYSAHRFLADSYSALPRHEIARVSELLQSQLLQPINITPVQPQLAESTLLILEGAGPAAPAFNEFNPLYIHDGLALQASAIVGSNDTYGDEVVQSGVSENLSYSLGQFHYETDGFRRNNDLTQDIYNVFIQGKVTPNTGLQAEYRHAETEEGDITLRFDPDFFLSGLRREVDSDALRLGYHYGFAPSSNLIASFILQDRDVSRSDSSTIQFPDGAMLEFMSDRTIDSEAYIGEMQYLLTTDSFDLIAGGGHYAQDITDEEISVGTVTLPDGTRLPPEPDPPSRDEFDITHGNIYLYSQLRLLSDLSGVFGVSADFFEDTQDARPIKRNQVNPKFGIIWNPFSQTTLRAAAFRVLKRALIANQTIEPTQVAGFNQFFDDVNGTDAKRYGVAIDQKVTSDWYAGIEISTRDLEVPVEIDGAPRTFGQDEELYRAYLYWTPNARITLSADYQFELLSSEFQRGNADRTRPNEVDTHRLPISLHYYHPNGFFAALRASYIDQKVEFPNAIGTTDEGDDQFWILDASMGYRLPNRWGILSVDVRNLLDQDFQFQDTDLAGEPRLPSFQPEQSVFFRATLSF